MTSAPIRVGVIGAGRIGSMHAELVARRVDGLALAAVCDTDDATARSVAEALAAEWVADPHELLERRDLDAVAICSSTDTHVDLLIAAVETGKAVFLEKPISLDLAEVDRGLAAVQRAGTYVQLGFNRRFDPAHASVREAVAAGAIGDVHVVRISSRDPFPPPAAYVRVSGGIFLDMTVHDFDLARFVTGSEVEEVYARGGVRVDPAIGEEGDLDTVVVTLRHADGALAVIDNSRRAVYGFDQRVEAFGSLGVASSENPLAHTGVLRTAEGLRGARLPTFFLERYIPSYLAEWRAFEQAVRAGAPSPVPAADGRAPLVAGLAAGLSVRERRPVVVSEIG